MARYFPSMQSCRFCHKDGHYYQMVKYSTRHYAHFACYLDAGKPLSDLPKWKIEEFPFRLIAERGLMEEVENLTAEPV